jgi:uncharacterized protein YcbX
MLSISELWAYPIKSCGGIQVSLSQIDKRGLLHDRSFMIVDKNGRMMTQREHPRMCLIRASFLRKVIRVQIPGIADIPISPYGKQDAQSMIVSVWDDTVEAIDQGNAIAKLLSSFLGVSCRLVRLPKEMVRKTRQGEGEVAFADGYPILGASKSSLEYLNTHLTDCSHLPMNRFRPNIVFNGSTPFAEDSWRRLDLGGVKLIGETLCARCQIPTIDQKTAELKKEPNATLATYRRIKHNLGPAWKTPYPNKVYFGRNFNVEGNGLIAVGEGIKVLEFD